VKKAGGFNQQGGWIEKLKKKHSHDRGIGVGDTAMTDSKACFEKRVIKRDGDASAVVIGWRCEASDVQSGGDRCAGEEKLGNGAVRVGVGRFRKHMQKKKGRAG